MLLSEHDRQISELAASIAAMEARLAQAKQGMVQLKVRRNACAPLFRLPTELLVRVASLAVRAECDTGVETKRTLSRLVSICHHLHGLYTHTPQLWTHIHTIWGSSFMNQLLERSRNLPLHLYATSTEDNHGEVVRRCLGRAQALVVKIRFTATRAGAARYMHGILNIPAPQVQDLRIHGVINFGPLWTMERDALKTAYYPGLTSLALVGISIISLPPLPLLLILDLCHVTIDTVDLRASLSQCPQLESFSLQAVDSRDHHSFHRLTLAPVLLARLRNLKLGGSLRYIGELLGILPDPSDSFHVAVQAGTNTNCNTDKEIVSRLKRFWDAHAGEGEHFPDGVLVQDTLSSVGGHDQVSFSTPISSTSKRTASLFFRFWSRSVAMDDYLLGNIKTLHLAHRRQGCAQSFHIDAGPDELDFNQMPRLDTLIVNDAVIKDESKWTAARELERWILSRRNQGMPFRSVEFRACEQNLKPIYEWLKTRRIVSSVTWSPDWVESTLAWPL
jgi:hypothetical protein